MANQNLSQFTEKLFVADADHTFIWDTAASISKRVSRNSWLNSGTLTSDAPVTISQTWNGTGSTVFKALVVNATTPGTTSSSSSLLLDLQLGGVSKVSVDKTSVCRFSNNGIFFDAFGADTSGFQYIGQEQLVVSRGLNGSKRVLLNSVGVFVGNASAFGFASTGEANATADTLLVRDGAANTLALRNGANAQTFNVYGTSSSSNTVYSRLAIACDTSGNATLTTQSTGVAGTVSINGVPVGLGKGNVSSNVAIGAGSLNANTTGSNNLALGANTLFLSTTATFNSALGENALRETTTGSFNVALGASAMQLNSTGASNTAVGVTAGAYAFNGGTSINNTTSSFSLFLGRDTKPDNIGQTNQIVIGYLANGIGSNSVVLGNDSITKTALKGNVGIGTTSPTSKLQVTGGDVEIETVTSGIIMKAAGTATRYRITLNAGGTALVFTAI